MAATQNTLALLKNQDLQVAKISGTSFAMAHKMGLEKIICKYMTDVPTSVTYTDGVVTSASGSNTYRAATSFASITPYGSVTSGNVDYVYWYILKSGVQTTFDCASSITNQTKWVGPNTVTLTSGQANVFEAKPRPFLTSCIYNFSATGAMATMNIPSRGKWRIQVWGAQGASSGGRGGYSIGDVIFTTTSPISVCVGNNNISSTDYTVENYLESRRSFNGGGAGQSPGGGATHVALNSRGQLNAYENYKNEVIIVAGGGGGFDGNAETVGVGGGLEGTDGTNGSYGTAGRGTQTSGGRGVTVPSTNITYYGSFGMGGDVPPYNYDGRGYLDSAGAGGGGWFGGGGSPGGWCGCGAGGSGYIQTATTCSYFGYTPLIPLTSASTKTGAESITEPDGTSATGHAGNGYARITWVSY